MSRGEGHKRSRLCLKISPYLQGIKQITEGRAEWSGSNTPLETSQEVTIIDYQGGGDGVDGKKKSNRSHRILGDPERWNGYMTGREDDVSKHSNSFLDYVSGCVVMAYTGGKLLIELWISYV